MGMPAMTIVFQDAAKNTVSKLSRGIIGMIIKDNAEKGNPVTIYTERDIPETLSKETKEQIELALIGSVNKPMKVVLYTLGNDAEDYREALSYFEQKKVNWLCCPTCKTDGQEDAVAEWVKEQRENRNKVKAILPETEANCEGVINYGTPLVSANEKEYTSEQFCSRITGILAGTPAKMSATFVQIPEATDCTNMKRNEIAEAIEAGKVVLYNDGEKIKIACAVNSLKATSEEKSESWKKIKVVETMDMINDDLTALVEDNYIGKYPNNYNNKCLLVSAISDYLKEIQDEELIEEFSVDFDTESIKDYLIKKKGIEKETVESMDYDTIKKQNTDDKVFLLATMHIVDAMEDITLNITL